MLMKFILTRCRQWQINYSDPLCVNQSCIQIYINNNNSKTYRNKCWSSSGAEWYNKQYNKLPYRLLGRALYLNVLMWKWFQSFEISPVDHLRWQLQHLQCNPTGQPEPLKVFVFASQRLRLSDNITDTIPTMTELYSNRMLHSSSEIAQIELIWLLHHLDCKNLLIWDPCHAWFRGFPAPIHLI